MTRMRGLVIAVLVGWSTLAVAQSKTPAELFADGQARYAAGEYLVAADKFEAAYALDPDPAYLFNIAQAYRFGNACAKAATSYRAFLAKVPDPPNAAKVQGYLDQSEECAKKQAAAQRPSPSPPDPVIVPRPPPGRPERNPGRAQRIAGIGVAAFGVAVLGAAGYYTWKTHDYAAEREGFCAKDLAAGPTCMWTEALENRDIELADLGHTAQTRARVSWAVGGAALIAGVVVYVLGRRPERDWGTIAIIPSTDGAMAVGALSF
jgi:tetratricopeptide (TPR) repeat protein